MTKRTNRRRCSDKHRRAGPSLPGNQSNPGGPKGRGTLDSQDSLSSDRAKLSRDGARILRILAACRTQSGNVVRTRSVLTARGKSSISRTDERRIASFEPRFSVASLPMMSSRGSAARAGRGTAGPSLLASPGERRSPELAAQGAANVRVRRECRGLSGFFARLQPAVRPVRAGEVAAALIQSRSRLRLPARYIVLPAVTISNRGAVKRRCSDKH